MPYLIVIFLALAASAGERFEFTETHMAAPVRIVLYAESADLAESAAAKAFARVKELDGVLSNYRKSELRDLAEKPETWVPVSEDLWPPLAAAHALMAATDGAFDVAVGPLAVQWRMAIFQRRLPRQDAIEALRLRTGKEAMALDASRRSVRLGPGVELDLGGIAKGYVADSAMALLAELGIAQALVDAGGDIALAGREWRVGIDDGVVLLKAGGIATSGDSQRFVEIDGLRYSHIVDPRTGIGITNQCHVTVIAESGMKADALATAVSVLGPKAGITYVETLAATEALVIQEIDGKVRRFQSSGFPQITTNIEGKTP